MSEQPDGDDEYRPTDYYAICRASYGIGSHEEAAVMNALRYAGPFSNTEEGETVSVAVWELYADSWETHSITGPERGAEQVSFTEYEIPVGQATEASTAATDAHTALDAALAAADVVREVDGAEGDEPDEDN